MVFSILKSHLQRCKKTQKQKTKLLLNPSPVPHMELTHAAEQVKGSMLAEELCCNPIILSYLPPHRERDKNDKMYHFLEGALRVTTRFSSTWHRTILTNDIGSKTSVVETTQVLNPSCHKSLGSPLLWQHSVCIHSVYIMGSLYLSLYNTRL